MKLTIPSHDGWFVFMLAGPGLLATSVVSPFLAVIAVMIRYFRH